MTEGQISQDKCNRLEVVTQSIADALDNTSSLVIVGVTFICVTALFVLADPTQIVSSALSGLFGIATGRAMK